MQSRNHLGRVWLNRWAVLSLVLRLLREGRNRTLRSPLTVGSTELLDVENFRWY